MKLFNVVVLYDVYVAAEDQDAAMEAIKQFILNGELGVSERKAFEAKEPHSIRLAWQKDQRPIVAGDVSDADFERCKGKTTLEVQDMIYRKAPAPKAQAVAPTKKGK